jgi:DNA polymerase I
VGEFEVALETLTRCSEVGVDTETTALHAQQDGRIRLIQLASPGLVYVCDLDAIRDWHQPLRQFLRDRDGPRLVFQEAVFDLGWLQASGLALPPWQRLFDVRLAARLTERRGGPGYKYDLRALAKRILGVDLPKELQRSDWSAQLTPAQLQYAANDAAILLDLHDRLVEDLDFLQAWDVFRLEHRLLPSMVWLRETGAPVDVPMLQARAAEAITLRDQKHASLHAIGGTVQELRPPNGLRKKDAPRETNEMNWGSTPQLKARLGLESTKKQVLLQLDPMPPVVEALLAWRGATKLADYGDKLLNTALIGDHVYGSFDSLGAATGRMSCRVPNLQQMNRGRHYREAIAAPPGYTLVKVDYSALQMRIAADISGDQALIDLFNAGGDPHTLTAEQVLGDANGRQAAKAINFGLLFGASAATLRSSALVGYGVKMTLEKAAEYRAAFFSLYPGLLEWHNRFEHKRNAPIDVEDPSQSGRVRRMIQGFNERINSPVQMVEAHGLKRAMIMLHARRAEHPDARLCLSVHDELVMFSPVDQAVDVGGWLDGIMHAAMEPLLVRVPVVTEVTIYPRWWKPKPGTLDDLPLVSEDDDAAED